METCLKQIIIRVHLDVVLDNSKNFSLSRKNKIELKQIWRAQQNKLKKIHGLFQKVFDKSEYCIYCNFHRSVGSFISSVTSRVFAKWKYWRSISNQFCSNVSAISEYHKLIFQYVLALDISTTTISSYIQKELLIL